jgi:ribosome-associated heat shock protein Hsp15
VTSLTSEGAAGGFGSLEMPPWDENGNMTGVRIDKWLWAARFFKTRTLAARACDLGRVESNGQPAKPAREVRVGDLLQVKNDSGDFQVEVLALSEMRGPAAVAQTLYRETEASREARRKQAEERKAMPHFEAPGGGRPTKRDRRQIGRLRGRG